MNARRRFLQYVIGSTGVLLTGGALAADSKPVEDGDDFFRGLSASQAWYLALEWIAFQKRYRDTQFCTRTGYGLWLRDGHKRITGLINSRLVDLAEEFLERELAVAEMVRDTHRELLPVEKRIEQNPVICVLELPAISDYVKYHFELIPGVVRTITH